MNTRFSVFQNHVFSVVVRIVISWNPFLLFTAEIAKTFSSALGAVVCKVFYQVNLLY